MPNLYRFMLAALATFRIAELFTVDDGPFNVFLDLRTAAGVYDLDANKQPTTMTGKLLDCSYCTGVWVAFAVSAALDRSKTFPLTWFAVAGAQALLQSIGGRK